MNPTVENIIKSFSDEEQLQLGGSDKFWKLVANWRKEKTISRAELERRLNSKNGSRGRKQKKSSVLNLNRRSKFM